MFQLNSLTIEGFRGFSEEQTLDLTGPFTLLFGENRTGKSSTLNALEWALYGKECVGAGTGMRERVGWEVANRYHSPQKVRVTAEFTGPTGLYKVTRTLELTAGRFRERVRLDLPDGTVLEATEAEARLARDMRYSFRDFLTTVYQHQEAIRAVLTQEPGERNEALDRLLGLSDYRNLLTAIDKAKLGQELKDASAQRDHISQEIETALRLRERDLSDVEDRAKGLGLNRTGLTPEGALKLASSLALEFTQLTAEGGLAGFELLGPSSSEDLSGFCESAHALLSRIRSATPMFQVQEQLLNRRSTIVRWQNELRNTKGILGEYETQVGEYRRRHVSIEAIESELASIASAEAASQERLREISKKAPLIREALTFLSSGFTGICPLCGKPEPQLVAHLQAEWDALVNVETKQIEDELQRLSVRKEDLSSALTKWRAIEVNLSKAEQQLAVLKQNVVASLDAELAPNLDLEEWLSQELTGVESRLATVEKSISEKMQKIDALESHVTEIRIILEYMGLASKIEILNAIEQSRQSIELEAALADIAELVADTNAIKDALINASNDEAKSKIQAASAAIDNIFRRTASRQSVTKVQLDVDSDGRTGRNIYSFGDQSNRDLMPILSQGDMNCLALSVFLGMAKAAVHRSPFGFLLLDDPSQSLGSEEKKALAELLRDVSKDTAVIVATMDSELRDTVLKDRANAKIAVYNFSGWAGESGPKIERAGWR